MKRKLETRRLSEGITFMGLVMQITAISAAVFVGMLGLCCWTVESLPNAEVKIVQCNSVVYFEDDPFAISLAYVLADLETVTPSRKGYDYSNISPYPNAFAYGHANCNQNLTSTDCQTCLGAANATMLSSCISRIGARSVLVDCSMRYEQYPFSD